MKKCCLFFIALISALVLAVIVQDSDTYITADEVVIESDSAGQNLAQASEKTNVNILNDKTE